MSTISAHFLRYTITGPTYNSHVDYIIQVVYHGRQWLIRKRYSEFDYFDKKIRRYYRNLLRDLPPKTYRYWGRLNHQIIIKRMKELELYLQSLLKNVASDNNLLKEFLEVDSNLLAYHLNSINNHSHDIILHIDLLQNIIKKFSLKIIPCNVQWRLENCSSDLQPSRKRLIKSSSKKPKKDKKGILLNNNNTSNNTNNPNDFRVLSWVSSSNIDLDDTVSLRDSFRESYLSQTETIDSNWRNRPSDDDDLESLPSIYSIKTRSQPFPSHRGDDGSSSGGGSGGERDKALCHILSQPVKSHSNSLNLVTSILLSHISTSTLVFPLISDLVVNEFTVLKVQTEPTPPPSPSKVKKSPRKNKIRKPSSSSVEDEAIALRITQTRSDSGRDNYPSTTGSNSGAR